MKINVINILKIAIIVLVVLWIGLLTFDYFKAQNNQKPLICLSEKNLELSDGTYYACNSFGYKQIMVLFYMNIKLKMANLVMVLELFLLRVI